MHTKRLIAYNKLTSNKKIEKYFNIIHSDPRCGGFFLPSFLTRPISRMCKYPSLLRVCFKN